ncbi:MAG TPA: gamma-glutamylcyclotransferase family protein [Gemmataceae bacterium]|jgi:gamma-glutamylcyclotransferase (GGCT)/AIG2-like uncharacterized protein YtfP|nr:gamma-glutamylcyclotransferase family protein [Gemmataceae bacterium]
MASLNLSVYGTLKRGFRNHRLLERQQFIREAVTLPRYRLFDRGAYPCLVEDAEAGVAVQGELWKIDTEILPLLDRLEGVPDLFIRREIVIEAFPEPVVAYFYKGHVSRYRDCGACWPPA